MTQLTHVALLISGGLFDSLWEGALIAGIVWLGLRALPQLGAATRYAIWLCTVAALAIVPAVTVLTPLWQYAPAATPAVTIQAQLADEAQSAIVPGEPVPQAAARVHEAPPAARAPHVTISQGLALAAALLWLLVASARGLLLAFDLLDLAKVRRSARPWSSSREFPVLLSECVRLPLAVGFLRPAVILPATLVEQQSADAVDTIVTHEVAHLRRYDVWTNAFARVLEAFLALNPVAWLVLRRLSIEREIACDDWVVERSGSGDVFARALVSIAACAGSRSPLAAPSAVGSKHSIVERIERLLDAKPRRLRLSFTALGASLMLFALVAFLMQSVLPVLAFAAPAEGGSRVASACAVPDRPVAMQMILYTHGQKKTWFAPLPTVEQYAKWFGPGLMAIVDVTVDASGKASNVVIESNPLPRVNERVKQTFMNATYKPALANCAAVASTTRTATVVMTTVAQVYSVVMPSYPDGWSERHPDSCKVPMVIHGGVPVLPASLKLPEHGTLSASARVLVDSSGEATSATIVTSSGQPAFDDLVLAAAKAPAYPLSDATGFKPVRPSDATLTWNATHGYRVYSKCTPLPTQYVWSTTYKSKGQSAFANP